MSVPWKPYLLNVLNTYLNYKKHFIYQNSRQMLDINEMYFLKSAPRMQFVILVQYAVMNEMGRMTFSQKCDHRHNLLDSSECFQKWIAVTPTSNDPCLFLNHDRPAANNRNIQVKVLKPMFVFLRSQSLKTQSHKLEVFLYQRVGGYARVHWYIQGWLIPVKHCCSSECSHLNFCSGSVVVSKWIVHLYASCMDQSAVDPSL